MTNYLFHTTTKSNTTNVVATASVKAAPPVYHLVTPLEFIDAVFLKAAEYISMPFDIDFISSYDERRVCAYIPAHTLKGCPECFSLLYAIHGASQDNIEAYISMLECHVHRNHFEYEPVHADPDFEATYKIPVENIYTDFTIYDISDIP